MAKKKEIKTSQMNVRIPSNILKDARRLAKNGKVRLGIIVSAALHEFIKGER